MSDICVTLTLLMLLSDVEWDCAIKKLISKLVCKFD